MRRDFLAARFLHPLIYRMGKREAFDACGMTYDDALSLRSIAYDLGRNVGENVGPRWWWPRSCIAELHKAYHDDACGLR